MEFKASVIKEYSLDPCFRIIFRYYDGNVSIYYGTAKLIRKLPKAKIIYDEKTQKKLSGVDKTRLELELMNKVLEYIFNNGVRRLKCGTFAFNSI